MIDDEVLAGLLRRVRRGPARLGPPDGSGDGSGEGGAGRLVVVDGPAGSGKTTLAGHLAAALAAPVVHMDDLYAGWSGMAEGVDRLGEQVLAPLAAGRPGRYQRYDWGAGRYAEWHDVPRTPFLVVEGCGAGARRFAPLTTLLVWVEADDELRLRRGLERDGAAAREHWLAWMAAEREMYDAEGTARRADVRLDGLGRVVGPDGARVPPGTVA
ncbi:nucleoside/nucleotide kinase family protein [Puerhibacterium puerhi]|uniref:(d)CMP kinase n=1 Tax=Puerhibacterium puerhi TaxID=2692623 RepID=UPI001F47EF07|nr:(d)CMP kinase [Puerhibacterium puerhi]